MPAFTAGPLGGHSDLVKTSTSRARAPGAGQGTRPTNSKRKWEKYVAFGAAAPVRYPGPRTPPGRASVPGEFLNEAVDY